jgi:hypothetical protein
MKFIPRLPSFIALDDCLIIFVSVCHFDLILY